MKQIYLIFLSLIFFSELSAQSVGIFQNDSIAFNGYTLFSPTSFNKTYLIDNCGYLVNEWESDHDPGMMAYLLPNGNLLRTARIGSSFNSGGTGGKLEIFDWNGNLIWSFVYSSDTYHQHHDVEVLPNGNILILAWDKKTEPEAIMAGRNPNDVGGLGLWSEKIIEIEPIGSNEVNIVWEWNLWDHLVQEFDVSLSNGGVVMDHPELIDLNFGAEFGIDWIHANGIDYNPELDQIIISSRNFNEFWVIDHSTTTDEAASHSGGASGMGGDILYRWGNPITYQRGDENDQKLFGQHDVHWIEPGLLDEGKIMIFNNGTGRPNGSYSSVDIISPPINVEGNYLINDGQSFEPDELEWTYTSSPNTDFHAARVSGAQRLPNGNTLICNGRTGEFFEVTYEGNQVWKYINPVGNNGPFSQGTNPTTNDVFKIVRYAPTFEGFVGKSLESGEPVELDPTTNDCEIFNDPISNEPSILKLENIRIMNNLVWDEINIENRQQKTVKIEIVNVLGSVVLNELSNQFTVNLNVQHLKHGIYFVRLSELNSNRYFTQKIMKF